MNITNEQYKDPDRIEVVDYMTMSYDRYNSLIALGGENTRLKTQVAEFKKSIFYSLYKIFN